MIIKVVYHTMTGNTKKVAEAIAEEVGVKAESLADAVLSEEVDMLFIGDGNYASTISPKTKAFIQKLDKNKIKKIALFGTYGGIDNAVTKMKKIAIDCALNVCDETYTCKGKAWGVIHKKNPDETDIQNARLFAKQMTGSHYKV